MKFPKLHATIFLVVAINIAAFTGFLPAIHAFAENHTVDDPMPFFENRYETDHFVLKWTNRSRHSRDNISDPQIIKDTAGYLETGLGKVYGAFWKKPLHGPRPGQDKGSFPRL